MAQGAELAAVLRDLQDLSRGLVLRVAIFGSCELVACKRTPWHLQVRG